jgi:hypothetical protein
MSVIGNKKTHLQKKVKLYGAINNACNLNKIIIEHLKTLREYDEKKITI